MAPPGEIGIWEVVAVATLTGAATNFDKYQFISWLSDELTAQGLPVLPAAIEAEIHVRRLEAVAPRFPKRGLAAVTYHVMITVACGTPEAAAAVAAALAALFTNAPPGGSADLPTYSGGPTVSSVSPPVQMSATLPLTDPLAQAVSSGSAPGSTPPAGNDDSVFLVLGLLVCAVMGAWSFMRWRKLRAQRQAEMALLAHSFRGNELEDKSFIESKSGLEVEGTARA